MASFPTPNVSNEQAVKQVIRANNTGGANSYWSNPVYSPVALVNATASGSVSQLFRLTVSPSGTSTYFQITNNQFTVSGLNGNTTVSGFNGLMNNALATTSGVLTFSTWNKPTDTLASLGLLDFIVFSTNGTVPSGNLTVSGFGSANPTTYPATISGVTFTASTLSGIYPNYYGTPNAVPTWVDDAIVHAYPIYGFGNTTQDTTKTEVKQVRQIQTGTIDGGSETQIWTGYFAAYQSNLNQAKQRNTKQQQC